ncbi:hypothetical protein PM082_014258 [Marasmius tenuissimus]|nr:hypothetical protein PM082_014258 [Marasmius tenuissimus]
MGENTADVLPSRLTHEDGLPVELDTNAADGSVLSDKGKGIPYRPEAYYGQFLTENAVQRKPSAIHALFPLEQTPGVISLLAGKPNVLTFPFLELSFTARDSRDAGNSDISVPISGPLLSQGLQYGATPGINGLLLWFEQLQELVHGRKAVGEGWRISIGCGSRELMSKTVQALVNPGGPVLVDSNSKNHLDQTPIFYTHPVEVVEIPVDGLGIVPSKLESILETWTDTRATPRPQVLYTIPFGVGPTTSRERRIEILKIAKRWDIVILEDDPYYYLSSPSQRAECPSYFSLERDSLGEVGQVLRYDTLSKIIAPGLSIGWVSGPEALVNAVDTFTSTANLQAGTVSQTVSLALLSAWGHEGFLKHVERVYEFYTQSPA